MPADAVAEGRVVIGDYTTLDLTDASQLAPLVGTLSPGTVLYFALPPMITRAVIDALLGMTLPDDLVLAMEKPFGDGVDSARSLNDAVRALVPEARIVRVDHFLGRSMLLNLLGVRLANRIWEPVWSAEHVESVMIRFDETLALENRAQRCNSDQGGTPLNVQSRNRRPRVQKLVSAWNQGIRDDADAEVEADDALTWIVSR